MAMGKSYFSKPSYRFLTVDQREAEVPSPMFEFDESDMWNSNQNPSSEQLKKPTRSSKGSKRSSKVVPSGDLGGSGAAAAASSLPVNIPDWSKILREDRRGDTRRRTNGEEDSDYDDGDDCSRVPPHEFLAKQFARTRIASFSVHEGVGRTLKGRDLSRVRDAIWEKTGFED